MKKEDEKILSELIKRYDFANRKTVSEQDEEFIISAVAYILKIKPSSLRNNLLSIREILCLSILAAGKNPDQCADMLGISVKSVNTYEQRVRKKLGAKNRTNAFYIAQVKGYISISIAA